MRSWRGVIAVEGVAGVDGRILAPGLVAWQLPVPLMVRLNPNERDPVPTLVGSVMHVEQVPRERGGYLLTARGNYRGRRATGSRYGAAVQVRLPAVTTGTGADDQHAILAAVTMLDGPSLWPECYIEIGD